MERVEPELDELVQRFDHRVYFFAGRVQQRFMLGDRWRDELVSAGYWGLFKALRNRRENAHDRELSAYVSQRVEGAVIDEARSCLGLAVRTEGATLQAWHGFEDNESVAEAWDRRVLAGGGDEAEDPERIVARRRRRDAIETALAELEPEQREWVHAYMEGDSLSEIARSRGVSPGTMQARFQKLARRVRATSPALRRMLLDDLTARA